MGKVLTGFSLWIPLYYFLPIHPSCLYITHPVITMFSSLLLAFLPSMHHCSFYPYVLLTPFLSFFFHFLSLLSLFLSSSGPFLCLPVPIRTRVVPKLLPISFFFSPTHSFLLHILLFLPPLGLLYFIATSLTIGLLSKTLLEYPL